MRRMVLRAAVAALVLSAAACSSSGGGGAAAPSSPSLSRVALPRGVSCGHFSDASTADREAWVARLLSEMDASGEIAVADLRGEVPAFARSVDDLCDGSARSDEAEGLAVSLARRALGR